MSSWRQLEQQERRACCVLSLFGLSLSLSLSPLPPRVYLSRSQYKFWLGCLRLLLACSTPTRTTTKSQSIPQLFFFFLNITSEWIRTGLVSFSSFKTSRWSDHFFRLFLSPALTVRNMFSRKLCSVLSPAKRTDKDDTYGKLFFFLKIFLRSKTVMETCA